MTDVSKLVVEVEAKGIKPTTEELKNLSDAGAKAEKNTDKVGKAAGKTVAPMKNMRAQAQQASYQFQDIAVQAQMGTNWFTIIGQQGSQLASVFGPSGAITGALIAFSAILGGVVYNSLNTAGEAMAALEEDMKSLEDNFDNLGESAKAYVRALVTKRIEGYNVAIAKQNEELNRGIKITNEGFLATERKLETDEQYATSQEKIKTEIERLNVLKEQDIKLIDDTTDATESLIKSLSEEEGAMRLSGVALALHKAGLAKANDEDRKKIRILAEKIEAYKLEQEGIKETIRQNAELLRSEEALSAYFRSETAKKEADLKKDADKLKRDKASAQNRLLQIAQSAMAEAELINSLETEAIAKEQADRDANLISQEQFEIAKGQLEEKYSKDRVALAAAEAQAKSDIQQQVLASMGGIAGQMAGIAAEGSKEAKVLFGIQKAIAIAQIIVSTEVAAAAAAAQAATLTGIAGYLASAAGVRAMGYASAGLVAGTAIAGGRALGGQVRGGESYLVGERGPELLTMGSSGRIATNENLKKAVGSEGGQAQTNVSVNFSIQANDTAGFDQLLNSRRGQIISMINQAVNDRGRASII